MRPERQIVGPLAGANVALIAASQTPVSGTALTLTGTQPDLPRRILLTYGNEAAPRTLTVTGTNYSGGTFSESLAVPSGAGGTVYTANDFKTVTSLMPLGGGWTAAVTVGTNGVASSPWVACDIHVTPANFSFACVVTGTVNYDVQYTLDSLGNTFGISAIPHNAWTVPTLGSLAINATASLGSPIAAWRVLLNSGTGSVAVTAIQAGMKQ